MSHLTDLLFIKNLVLCHLLQIFQARSKVMEWLEQQSDFSAVNQTGDTSELNLLETINVSPESEPSSSVVTKFSVSQLSSSIAVASVLLEPSLFAMHPGTDKPPIIFSKDNGYMSAMYIIISGKEYLVASSEDEIHLWNLEKNTSSVVYKFNGRNGWHLCVKDERTIACTAVLPASDGFYKMFILNADTERFYRNSTMWVKANQEFRKISDSNVEPYVSDTCYTRTRDGSSCLLLIFPLNHIIQCVEIVGMKVRWQVDHQQMGKSFVPMSACTDGSTVCN